jgi:starch-binding outer membrane protein, SusD/RagB family
MQIFNNKKMKIYKKFMFVTVVITSVVASSCNKEYFNRPPKSAVAIGNFYQTADQVNAATNVLYSVPWFGWNTHAGWSISELSGGNARSYSSDIADFATFTVNNQDRVLDAAWNSLYTEVAQANALINTLPTAVPSSVSKSVVNNALGEARLWRALAYFHLVRIYGPVPIIENTSDDISNFQLPRNPVADVYKFIVNDLLFAEANCTAKKRGSTYSANAHVSSGSASALLAKVYLYMQDYTDARAEAEKVINSGEFQLYGIDVQGKQYSDLFLTANNNNEESIIALQWSGGAAVNNNTYGYGNSFQASAAASSQITGTGDGYGEVAPTFDLMDEFDPADLRRKPTFMIPGDHYPELDQAAGGYTYPAGGSAQGTNSATKKYVVGTPADNGGVGAAQSAANNTYMLRYADMFLIEAEAVMAGATTSTDPVALNAINTIRKRAGLAPLTQIRRFYTVANPSYTLYGPTPNASVPVNVIKDDIIEERRREFAFEDDFFYDLMRVDGFNNTAHTLGIKLMEQQDRGTAGSAAPIVRYGNIYLTVTASMLQFQIPAVELAADPKLLDTPVPYVFK